jgi:repressor of nif and glnA expression
MNVHPDQKYFFLASPVMQEALNGRLCKRHKLKQTDLIILIAANLFYEDAERFSTKSILQELKKWGYPYVLRTMQYRFNNLVRAGFLECVRADSYAAYNAKMPALYVITSTGKYVVRDLSGKLKEAVRRLERV